MATRPVANAAKLLLSHAPKRSLRIGIPPDHPSVALTSSGASSKKPLASEDASESKAIKGNREFNTSRANKAVGDTSTIDFAFLPNVSEEAGTVEKKVDFRVPIISAIYSGQHVRAFGEENSEDEIRDVCLSSKQKSETNGS
jgi:hypothetical protein